MKRGYHKSIIVQIAILLGFCRVALGQTVWPPIPLDSFIKESKYIIEGMVISSTPIMEKDSSYTFTSNIVKINKIFKGNLHCGNLAIKTVQNVYIMRHISGGLYSVGQSISEPTPSLCKGNIGIFICTGTPLPSDTVLKENPKNLYLVDFPLVYNNHDRLDTNSLRAEGELFEAKIGHRYTSCTGNEPLADVPVKYLKVFPDTTDSAITLAIPDSTAYLSLKIINNYAVVVYQKQGISAKELQNLDVSYLKKGKYRGSCYDVQGGLLYYFEFAKKDAPGKIAPSINLPVKNIKAHPYHVTSTISLKIHEPDTQRLALVFYDDSGRAVFKMNGLGPKALKNFFVSFLKPGNYTGTAASAKNSYHFKFVKM